MTVAVCIPSIPPRRDLLNRAVSSALRQTTPADELHVAIDHTHAGAADTRNRAWHAASTEWVAFLDDDDEFDPIHLEALSAHAQLTGADVVYSWYQVVDGTDPHPHVFGQPWDPDHPVQTTVTCLWRRVLLEQVGGFRCPGDTVDEYGERDGEDFDIVKRANAQGARISHLPERTWRWHHHSSNTSGLPDRW
jgi:glycosyltransferase involved in cell wall biosynthesis